MFDFDITLPKQYTLESSFTTDFLKEFKKTWWAFKISDLARTIKPFDWFWINKDWAFFCEVKIITWDYFDINQLRNNQFTSLEKIHLLAEKYDFKNVHPIVLVYSFIHKDYKAIPFEFLLNRYNRWINKIKLFNHNDH